MGGKGGDSGGSQQQDMASMQRQATTQAQQDVASAQAKAAASQPAEEPKTTEEPAKTDPIQSIDQTTADKGGTLTGLGDQLVSGLAAGRVQQVKDQTERVDANPQTYGTQYDPYTGTFVGQGPYTPPKQPGVQV
jgi:hypothetical protein